MSSKQPLSFSDLNKTVLLIVFSLLGIGLVLIYSSSFIFAAESFGDEWFFFKKQVIFAAVTMGCLFVFAYTPFKWIQKSIYLIWFLILIAVILTLIPGIGLKIGGASRWLQLTPSFRFQPSELLKIFSAFMIASLVLKPASTRVTIIKLLFFLAPILLLLKQPDFGSFVVLSFLVITLLFIFGLRWGYVVTGIATAGMAFYFLVVTKPYRLERVKTFIDPWSYPDHGGYQVIQSLLSFYSGGLFGVGLGQGQSKLFFLPEAHTDFAMSVLAEETGFVGVLIVLLLYASLIIKSFQIGARVKDSCAQCVALGLSILFTLMVLINVGVVLGLLPTKGLTLPFLSYGGSSLISMGILFGLLLNIERTFLKNS